MLCFSALPLLTSLPRSSEKPRCQSEISSVWFISRSPSPTMLSRSVIGTSELAALLLTVPMTLPSRNHETWFLVTSTAKASERLLTARRRSSVPGPLLRHRRSRRT